MTRIMNGKSEHREMTESKELGKGLSVWASMFRLPVKAPRSGF